jgi:hypothetical protein
MNCLVLITFFSLVVSFLLQWTKTPALVPIGGRPVTLLSLKLSLFVAFHRGNWILLLLEFSIDRVDWLEVWYFTSLVSLKRLTISGASEPNN